MPTMTKKVNINAPVAIRTITPPIYGRVNGIIMTTGDILKCLCKRAIVDEILPNGSTVRLTMKNYYMDNGAGLDAKKEEVAPKVTKVPESKKEEEKKTVENTKVEETASEVKKDVEIVTGEEPVAVVDPAIITDGEEVTKSEMVVDPAIEIVSSPNTDIDPALQLHEYNNEEVSESEGEADVAFVTGMTVEGDGSSDACTEATTTVASTETAEEAPKPAPKKKSTSSKKKSTSTNSTNK